MYSLKKYHVDPKPDIGDGWVYFGLFVDTVGFMVMSICEELDRYKHYLDADELAEADSILTIIQGLYTLFKGESVQRLSIAKSIYSIYTAWACYGYKPSWGFTLYRIVNMDTEETVL